MDRMEDDQFNELPFLLGVDEDDDSGEDDDLNEDDDFNEDDYDYNDDDEYYNDDDDYDDDDDDDYNDDDDIAYRTRNTIYRNLGRSYVSFLRDNCVVLLSTSRSRNDKSVFSTPLHMAVAKSKNLQSVEHFLKNAENDKNCTNRHGETALLLGIEENIDENIINMLFEYGCDPSICSTKGISPLHIAALDNKVDIMRQLISKGANVNVTSNIGVTPLHLAVLASHYEAVCVLLNSKADPTLPGNIEFTPLMLALGFRDIDIRISELLCTYDINTPTRLANPIYCAVKTRHSCVHSLLIAGADVNYVGNIRERKTSCILEASSLDKHLFLLIWARVDQDIFKEKLTDFLVYFADNCSLRGSDLVECLAKVLASPHSVALIKSYYVKCKSTFLQRFFDDLDFYQLTGDNCCDIICALPIIFYEDISYVYKKFNFNKELETLLKSYEFMASSKNINKISYIYIDYICYNASKSNMYNLKEILHFLKFCTPDSAFRAQFYEVFSSIAGSSDRRLSKLIILYKSCSEVLASRSVASLQELARDKLRKTIFLLNQRPYKAISDLVIPDVIKEILFLKMPIYSV